MASVVTLDNTLGAALVGAFFAAILYGFTTILVILYFTNYPNDWRVQKISVAILWILDSLHLSLTIATVYHYVVTSFGSLLAIQLVDWTLKLQIAVNIGIILFVQTLYAIRVWKLGHGHHHRAWPVFVVVVVGGGYAVGVLLARETYRADNFGQLHFISWAIITSFVTSTSIDVVLSGAMCYYLIKSRSGFSGSNSTIYYIIRMTLISGALTSACSLTALIAYVVMPKNLVFLAIEFLLTKLYINSFLAMLNARQSIRENSSTMSSGNSNKMMNIRTITSSHVHHDNTIDSPLTPGDDKNFLRMTPFGDRNHGLDSTSSLEENRHSSALNGSHPAADNRMSRVTFV